VNFTVLLGKVLDIVGDFRVRISSIEPEGFDQPLFEMFAHKKLCPHLHLCLQSGSDRILMQMHRVYNTLSYLRIIGELKKRYDLFNFTTDIMVGFPGETEEDFNLTYNMIREVGFSHVHTFKYSERRGTRAERMPDQIPEKIRQERSLLVRNLADDNKLVYRRQFIGREQTVLVEKVGRGGLARGYGEHYVPVEFHSESNSTNFFSKVMVRNVIPSRDFVLKANAYNSIPESESK
jgi:threonylcarbamoyladenosine tRNA methylthiotransferase MtaB